MVLTKCNAYAFGKGLVWPSVLRLLEWRDPERSVRSIDTLGLTIDHLVAARAGGTDQDGGWRAGFLPASEQRPVAAHVQHGPAGYGAWEYRATSSLRLLLARPTPLDRPRCLNASLPVDESLLLQCN
jgi:hypothetical protein